MKILGMLRRKSILELALLLGGCLTILGFFMPWYSAENFMQAAPSGWVLFTVSTTSLGDFLVFFGLSSLVMSAFMAIFVAVYPIAEKLHRRLLQYTAFLLSILLAYYSLSLLSILPSDPWLFPSSQDTYHVGGYYLTLIGACVVLICVYLILNYKKGANFWKS